MIKPLLLHTVVLALLHPFAAQATTHFASVENHAVRLVYDLKAGTFNVLDPQSGRTILRTAHTEVGEWISTDQAFARTASVSATSDEMGNGRRLFVRCERPDGPTLLAEFTVHGTDDPAVVLRAGIINTTAAAIRIKAFRPLADGVIVPEGGWTAVRTLNGDSGSHQNLVTPQRFRSSANNLLLTFRAGGERRTVLLGGFRVADFTRWAHTRPPAGLTEARAITAGSSPTESDTPVLAAIDATDPIGKPVGPGATYLPDDSFYFDGGTADPFLALENYGRKLRTVTRAAPHAYDFPTICAWYVGVWKTKGAQNHPENSRYRINTTTGLVEELEQAHARGFLRYTSLALRLVPDTYQPINPQGWWDDAHWRQGGYYTAPYDTSQAFGRAIHARGGLAFTYLQPNSWVRLSQDFREQHTDWLCGGMPDRGLDYTLPAVQEHMRQVTAAMRGGIDGVMVDYADGFWRRDAVPGGFSDSATTATAFYRLFFRLLKGGLGTGSWLHERNLSDPNNDLTLGIVDLQRTSRDTDTISADIVSRGGLRWYKNRVVLNYDMDSKDLNTGWKSDGFNGKDRDGRRMLLTMAYVASSRLLLANSFRDLSEEALHDLTRVLPFTLSDRSARPVDAFVSPGWPRVYDLAINQRWHQVTLYNSELPTTEGTFSIPLSGEQVEGALGLVADRNYYAYDFWNDRFVGCLRGSGRLEQTLRPGEARMISLHEVEANPQFLSTNRHLMQGCEDMALVPAWNHASRSLSGASKVVGGETYEVTLALNGWRVLSAATRDKDVRIRVDVRADDANLAILKIDAAANAIVEWEVVCERRPLISQYWKPFPSSRTQPASARPTAKTVFRLAGLTDGAWSVDPQHDRDMRRVLTFSP